MTRTLLLLLAAFLFTAGTGCGTGRGLLQHKAACSACGGGGCQACGTGGHLGEPGCTDGCGIFDGCGFGSRLFGGCGFGSRLFGGGGVGSRLAARNSGTGDPAIVSGPPAAQTAYPYYTVRGPRDFFLDDPPPLGP